MVTVADAMANADDLSSSGEGDGGGVATMEPSAANNNSNSNNAVATRLPPYDDKVKVKDLKQYSAAEVSADKYYGPHESQKPIVLMIMGIGVDGFVDPEEVQNVDAVEKTTNRSKSHKYNKSEIDPTTRGNGTKDRLLKEQIRRAKVCNLEEKKYPQHSNKPIKHIITWLKNNPPPVSEHEYIKESYEKIIKELEAHIYEKSGSKDANMWRLVRLIECMLHASLRQGFLQRNRQLSRHELDGRNSPDAPKSYYENVADLHNSDEVITSTVFSDDYGEPFHEPKQLLPVPNEHHVTGQSVKESMSTFKSSILCINANIGKSGQGEGSHDNTDTIKGFVRNPRMTAGKKKAVGANGDAMSYLLLRLEQEKITAEFLSVADGKVAATMKHTPRIDTGSSKKGRGRKRKGSSATKNDKNDSTSQNLLQRIDRMEKKQMLEDMAQSIQMLQQQITAEETSLLSHSQKLGEFMQACLPFKLRIRSGELTEEDVDEWEIYEVHNGNVQETKKTREDIKVRINTLNAELDSAKEKYEDAKKEATKAEEDSGEIHNADEEEEIDEEYNLLDSDDDEDIFAVGSNDGSATLDDNNVPGVEIIN